MNLIGILSSAFKQKVLQALGDVDDYSDKMLETKASSYIRRGIEHQNIAQDIDQEAALEELNAFLRSQKDGIKSDRMQTQTKNYEIDRPQMQTPSLASIGEAIPVNSDMTAEQINAAIASMTNSLNSCNGNIAALENAIAQAQQDLASLQEQKTQEEEKKQKAQEEYDEAQKTYDENEKELIQIKSEYAKVQKAIQKEMSVFNNNKQSEINKRLSETKAAHKDSSEANYETYVKQTLESVAPTTAKTLSPLLAQEKSLSDRGIALEESMSKQAGILEAKQIEINTSDEKIKELDELIAQQNSHISDLTSQKGSFEGQSSALSGAITAAGNVTPKKTDGESGTTGNESGTTGAESGTGNDDNGSETEITEPPSIDP